ncbi:MAG: acyl-CoA dehydrogenase family protein [Bacteroidales bacterium]|nr:acyl-CoA dehydrogenase family protein [Bacteroidales bacterium]
MNPFTTDKHEAFRNKIREFAEQEIRPEARKLDQEERFSPELTQKMAGQGLFGVAIPGQYGGQGLDYMALVIAVEEIARIDGSQAATITAVNSLGLGPIYKYGTEKQRQRFLPPITRDGKTWAFGLTERDAGSDSGSTRTHAELIDGLWHINGSKMFISNSTSDISAGITVQAITGKQGDRDEFSTILVEADREGYIRRPIHNKMVWRAADTGELQFRDVTVPEENLLGERGKGHRIMLETLDSGRLTVGAMGLGLARGAYEMALDYAQKRVQFGRPISKFQSISFKLAEMATKIETAKNMLYQAAWLKIHDQPFGKEAAMAKLYTSEVAKEVADEAVQIHGGYGLIQEYDIERFFRDQRILQIGEGTSEVLKLVIARKIGL